MQRLVDVFGQIVGDSFDRGQVLDARIADAAQAAKALQEPGPFLRTQPRDVLQRTRPCEPTPGALACR